MIDNNTVSTEKRGKRTKKKKKKAMAERKEKKKKASLIPRVVSLSKLNLYTSR